MAEATFPQHVPGAGLRAFIAAAFEAVQVSHAEARTIAELMTQADLNGSEGHGVFRLPHMVKTAFDPVNGQK